MGRKEKWLPEQDGNPSNGPAATYLTQSEFWWKSATVWLSYSGENRPNSSYWMPTSSNAWVISWAARKGERREETVQFRRRMDVTSDRLTYGDRLKGGP